MSVLSFRKSVDQLDQIAEWHVAMQRVFSRCIQSAAEYAVELKSDDARVFRANLERLSAQVEHVNETAQADQLQSSFRGELRAYRDLSQLELRHLRAEKDELVDSMQTFLANAITSGSDHQQTLRREFDILEVTAQSGDLAAIRGAIHRAADTAMKSCEEIQRAQEVVIAQLQDEIRHLHKEVGQERRAALTDPITGVWNRAKLDSRIKDLLLLNECFCVFFVSLPSLAHIARNDPRLSPGFLRALTGRLSSVSGKNGEIGMAGRWSEEVFSIVFNLPLSGAPITPATVERILGGSYAIQHEGASSNIQVQVRVQAVERPKDSPESSFYLQLGQAAFNVTVRPD